MAIESLLNNPGYCLWSEYKHTALKTDPLLQ